MSTPEEIQADIERQREHLARTVDEIGHKLDVKARARPQVVGAAVVVVLGASLLVWRRRRR